MHLHSRGRLCHTIFVTSPLAVYVTTRAIQYLYEHE
jgi:hypothetical protein